MKRSSFLFITTMFFVGLFSGLLQADQLEKNDREQQIRASVERGLKLVQKAADNYPQHRKCFSCHHQTLPLLAMREAQSARMTIDEKIQQTQLEFTRSSFAGRRENLKNGKRIGGRAITVGYGLWTFQIVEETPDDLAADMVTYLLKTQESDGHWRPQSNRPPLEESNVMCTVLAAYGMQLYASELQQEEVEKSFTRAKDWLDSAPLKSQEDKVARLWGLSLFDGKPAELESARKLVIKEQHDDGGWPQLTDMESDAYATGQTLYVLQETGTDHSAESIQLGIDFLLKTQQKDGSWFVKTRSKPVQRFFDNGDPHGKSQFISTAATSWAAVALAKSLSETASP